MIAKVTESGNTKVLVTERGVSFGYNNLVVDPRAFPMLRALGYPVIFDVTHSLQLPGAGDGVTAGLAEYIEPHGAGRRGGRRRRRVHGSARGAQPRQERRPPTRCGSISSNRSCGGSSLLIRSSDMPDLTLARKVLQTEAAAVLALVDRVDDRFAQAVDADLPVQGPRHRHRHGQVGHRLPQDRGDAGEHRHARVLPSSRRSRARRSRRHPGGRRRDRDVVQRRDGRTDARAGNAEADRRAADRVHRRREVDARAGGQRRARLQRAARKRAR